MRTRRLDRGGERSRGTGVECVIGRSEKASPRTPGCEEGKDARPRVDPRVDSGR